MSVSINQLPGSEIELVGELAWTDFAAYRPEALKLLGENATLDGFRPGHIPEKVLVDKLGEQRILVEMAELAIQKLYPQLIIEYKIDAIGRPEIQLTKLAKDNPLGYKIKTAIHPEVTLPDYKKLAKDINATALETITVEDKEVDEVMTELENNKADLSKIENPKETIKQNLKLEKEAKQKDKRRLEIVGKIATDTKVELPKILVETELDKMLAELKDQIERMGLKLEGYLEHLKKTETELRSEWQADAERRVKTALVLAKIADVEKIGAPAEEIEKEVLHMQQHYKGVAEERLRQYVANILINEYVFRFLEEQK